LNRFGAWATNSGEHVTKNARVRGITGITSLTDNQKVFGGTGAGLEEDASDSDTINVSNFDSRSAIGWDQSGKTHTKDNSVGIVDLDGFLKVVITRLE
jgi:hypothetical protein